MSMYLAQYYSDNHDRWISISEHPHIDDARAVLCNYRKAGYLTHIVELSDRYDRFSIDHLLSSGKAKIVH